MIKLQPETSPADVYVSVFGALSEPVRVEIVKMIAGTDELACTVLDDTLPISKSTISYHIKVLYHANLIQVRKAGRNYFYKLRGDVFERLLPGFLDDVLPRRSSGANGSRSKRQPAGVA